MQTSKVTAALQRIRTEQDRLLRRRKRLLEAVENAAEHRKNFTLRRLCRRLEDANSRLEQLEAVQSELERDHGTREYVISSLFLHQCFKDLTKNSFEQFFFITGCEIDGRFILDQKAEFEHSKRNAVAVVGEPKSTHRLLIKLEEFGHRLLAHFHSHPGNGLGMTLPSITDRGFQQRLESAGYPTVAAIFSRDGYVRFFRLDENLTIAIHGTGAEEVEPNVYHLSNIHSS
jgi:hypothetical protein